MLKILFHDTKLLQLKTQQPIASFLNYNSLAILFQKYLILFLLERSSLSALTEYCKRRVQLANLQLSQQESRQFSIHFTRAVNVFKPLENMDITSNDSEGGSIRSINRQSSLECINPQRTIFVLRQPLYRGLIRKSKEWM